MIFDWVSHSDSRLVSTACAPFTFEQIDLQSSSREKERLAEEVQTLKSLRSDMGDSQQGEQQSSRKEDLKVATVILSHLVTMVVFHFLLSVWSGALLRNWPASCRKGRRRW